MVRAEEAAAACGLAVSTWYQLMSSGQTPPSIKLGKARLWRMDILQTWVAMDCPNFDKFQQLTERKKHERTDR
jgi:predicted DNA-binding transcriptional regulator AlpA